MSALMRRRRVAVAIAATALLLAGCGQGGDSADDTISVGPIESDVQAAYDKISAEMPGVTPQLIQAAKQEGKVMYYHLANPGNKALITAFKQTFPFLDVDEFEDTGGALAERYRSEASAGKVAADIFMSSTTADVNEWIDEGLVMKYKISNDAQYPDEYKVEGYRYPTSYSTVGVGWNTKVAKITDDEIAKLSTWEGLTDSGLLSNNRIGILNIASGGVGQSAYYIMQQKWGDKIFQALAGKKKDLLIYGGSAPMSAALQSGEISVAAGMSDTSFYSSFNDGAPIQWVYPTPVAIAPYVQIISAKAPHPNAGKLFQEFAFTKTGQAAFAGVSTPSFRKDVGNLQKVTKEPWFKQPTDYYAVDDEKFAADLPGLIDKWNSHFGG